MRRERGLVDRFGRSCGRCRRVLGLRARLRRGGGGLHGLRGRLLHARRLDRDREGEDRRNADAVARRLGDRDGCGGRGGGRGRRRGARRHDQGGGSGRAGGQRGYRREQALVRSAVGARHGTGTPDRMSGRAPERWRSTAPEDVLGSGMRILREVVRRREHGERSAGRHLAGRRPPDAERCVRPGPRRRLDARRARNVARRGPIYAYGEGNRESGGRVGVDGGSIAAGRRPSTIAPKIPASSPVRCPCQEMCIVLTSADGYSSTSVHW